MTAMEDLEAENERLSRTLALLAENRRLRIAVAANGLPVPAPRSMLADIAYTVAEDYGVSVEDLQGPRRTSALVEARQCFMWRADQVVQGERKRWSRCEIGRYLARDHTTVIHGVRRHEKRLVEEAIERRDGEQVEPRKVGT